MRGLLSVLLALSLAAGTNADADAARHRTQAENHLEFYETHLSPMGWRTALAGARGDVAPYQSSLQMRSIPRSMAGAWPTCRTASDPGVTSFPRHCAPTCTCAIFPMRSQSWGCLFRHRQVSWKKPSSTKPLPAMCCLIGVTSRTHLPRMAFPRTPSETRGRSATITRMRSTPIFAPTAASSPRPCFPTLQTFRGALLKKILIKVRSR